MTKFTIENHTTLDKKFGFYNSNIYFNVDFDDVNHEEVDAATQYIQQILNQHWDQEEFKKIYKDKMIQTFNDPIKGADLREEWETFEEFWGDNN